MAYKVNGEPIVVKKGGAPQRANIADIVPLSTVDWEGKVCMVIFFRGCPYRCPYCCNARYREGESLVTVPKLKQLIRKNAPALDAVMFSGGEPVAQSGPVKELARFAHELGLLTGLQTSGAYPYRLYTLLSDLDAVFFDLKGLPSFYHDIHPEYKAQDDMILSLKHLDAARRADQLSFLEIRTTVFEELNDNPSDIQLLSCLAHGCDRYVLQQGRPELCPGQQWQDKKIIDIPTLRHLAKWATPHVKQVYVRSRFGLERIDR